MITLFEKFKRDPNPQVGDYVVVNVVNNLNTEVTNAINNTIGRIIDIDFDNVFGAYFVEFDILDYKNYAVPLTRDEIEFFSKSKKELEEQVELEKNMDKYNL